MSKSKFACEAIKAAQACRSNAEERFRRNGNGRLTQGDPGFEDPIPLPRGRRLVTLGDAGNYITKLPKAEHEAQEWQAAMWPKVT